MRVLVAIALIFVAGLFVVMSKACKYPHFVKHRTKLREIRGFKPEYISTAIGFGKRQDPTEVQDFDDREEILLSLPRNLPHSVLAEVLHVIQTNPMFANKLMQLPMQNDQSDEELMTDRSRPKRIPF